MTAGSPMKLARRQCAPFSLEPGAALAAGPAAGRPAGTRPSPARGRTDGPPVVRRPRACLAHTLPGGFGNRAGRHDDRPARSFAGLGQARADNARANRVPGSTDLEPVSAAETPSMQNRKIKSAIACTCGRRWMERREAPRVRKDARTIKTAAPVGAPLPRALRGDERRSASPAPEKIRAVTRARRHP
jgi:hypothetical protein